MAINIESEEREDSMRRTKRCDVSLTRCIFRDFCEEACLAGAIVETHIFKYHGEKKGDLHIIRPILLTIDDKYGAGIAKCRVADAPYR